MELLTLSGIMLLILSIIAFKVYHITHNDYFLIGATGILGNGMFTIIGVMYNIQNVWVTHTIPITINIMYLLFFAAFIAMSIIGAIALIYHMYKDEEYMLFDISVITLLSIGIIPYLGECLSFQSIWIPIAIIVTCGCIWLNRQDIYTYNPFKCR